MGKTNQGLVTKKERGVVYGGLGGNNKAGEELYGAPPFAAFDKLRVT